MDDHDQDVYTVADFCEDNPDGVYILAIAGHAVCVVGGHYYDSWDSGGEIPIYYWRNCEDEIVKICDLTEHELNDLRSLCNFTRDEKELFNHRSRGYSLEDCADFMNMSVSTVKRVNSRMKDKIRRVMDRKKKYTSE